MAEEISELYIFDKQINAQREFDKKFPAFTQAPASSQKVCNENESRRKNDRCLKRSDGRKEFIRCVQKTHVMDIKQLQVNNS